MLKNSIIFMALLLVAHHAKSQTCLPSQDLSNTIRNLEIKNGLPTNSLKAILNIESCFKKDSINSEAKVSSYGVGQITIATAKHRCKINEKEIMDLKKNLECSASVLSFQYKRWDKDLTLAVLSYNEGTPCVCNGKKYIRRLGRGKTQTCKKWTKTKKGWNSKVLKCNVKDQIRITDYYKKFQKAYFNYLTSSKSLQINMDFSNDGYTQWQ